MALNKDGLEPGQPVDFATIRRVEHERAQRASKPDESKSEPRKATRSRKPQE